VIDKDKLLAWLARWQDHRNLLVFAVIAGLIAAVKRGDLDADEERKEEPDGGTQLGAPGREPA
jgi:hypothetical protein